MEVRGLVVGWGGWEGWSKLSLCKIQSYYKGSLNRYVLYIDGSIPSACPTLIKKVINEYEEKCRKKVKGENQ
jgi:hypothetical protein